MNTEKVKAYFERIGLELPEKIIPDAALLRKIHGAHCMIVPFENIDYLNMESTPVDYDSIYERIVTQRRGGVCLDVNTLLGWLLQELGYKVLDYGVKNYRDHVEDTPRWHKVLRVTDCEGTDWWCDVGDNEVLTKWPLLFAPDIVQEDSGERYRFEKCNEAEWMLWIWRDGGWVKNFGFTERVYSIQETYEAKCNGFDPDAPFTKIAMFGLKTENGRKSLTGNTYREITDGKLSEKRCSPEDMPWAYAQFGLKYPPELYKNEREPMADKMDRGM